MKILFLTHAYPNYVPDLSLHLSPRIPLLIPRDFKDSDHLLHFSSLDELRMKIDRVARDAEMVASMVTASRNHLSNYHLTTNRVDYFIQCMTNAF